MRAATAFDKNWFWRAFAGTVAISLLMRVTFANQVLSWNELLGLVAALPLICIPLPVVNAALVLIAIVCSGLAPYTFLHSPQTFAWMPFVGFLEGNWDKTWAVALEKGFLYGGAVWLVRLTGRGRLFSGLLVATVLLAIELAQMYLPGRSPEIADPLIALLAILVLERKKT